MDSKALVRRLVRLFVPMIASAMLLAACSDVGTSGPDPDPTPQGWTGRYHPGDGLGWSSNRDLTRTQFVDRIASHTNAGWLIVDVDMRNGEIDTSYALLAHTNPDGRAWALHHDLTSQEFHDRWLEYRSLGYRPLDVEGYEVDGVLRFAGIWIDNVEDLAWASPRNLTSSEYADYFDERSAEGYRPIDIEIYPTDDGPRVAAIWYENVGDVEWTQLRNIDRARYQQESTDHGDDGYLMIDYETYDGGSERLYAAIWEKPAQRPAYQIRTNRSPLGFANLWRTYRDEGYRLADFEFDDDGDDGLYGGIWIENAERFRYARKGALDAEIRAYRTANSIPAVSVAVIHEGRTIYRRGFGEADPVGPKVAHAGTVYGTASVAKVIGGTLAALLEANGALRDGTAVDLDLTDPTSDYLTGMPSHHTHTVEQLTAHLGCVAHYGTSPSIANQTVHYTNAQDAVESIWDVGLVNGCTVGSTRSYSTPAFTFLGAVLEEVTGRSLAELLDEEIFSPNGMGSFRVQFEDTTLPANYERAVPNGSASAQYDDSSWKVLGGGLEGNVLDLAQFGWRLLDGRIVDAATRDDRLWTPVDTNCSGPGGGTCMNGLGWELGTAASRRVAEHGGNWSGMRSWLRIHPDDDLVIALMSSSNGHDPRPLLERIANEVLAP